MKHKGPPPGQEDDRPNTQIKFQDPAAEITCASMRADELRGCLIREIFRAAVIGMQAQVALLDGDDDLALDNLRRHWRVIRAGISPASGRTPGFNGRAAMIAGSQSTRPCLRLVPREPPPRRRLSVRINVLDGCSPFGRSRVFFLAESDIDELIATTQLMERRA